MIQQTGFLSRTRFIRRAFIAAVLALTAWGPAFAAAQTLAAIDYFTDQYQHDVARTLALSGYNNNPSGPDSLAFLERYVNSAMSSGYAEEALPYSRILIAQTTGSNDWAKHAAQHVKLLVFAGEVDEAKDLVRILETSLTPNQRNQYQDLLDYAYSRHYRFRFDFDADAVAVAQLRPVPWQNVQLIPYPQMDTHSQFVTSLSVNSPFPYQFKNPGSWNQYIEVTATGSDYYKLRADVLLEPKDIRQDCQQARWGHPQSEAVFTLATERLNWKDQGVFVQAKALTGQTPYETVQNICTWASRNIMYVPPGADGGGSASEILAKRYGHCAGATGLVVALMRANNIPARSLRGHSAVKGNGGPSISHFHHTITEFYLDGVGWVQWDFNQTPGVIAPDFLGLWSEQRPAFSSEGPEETEPLHFIQRLGLSGFLPAPYGYDYARYELLLRFIN